MDCTPCIAVILFLIILYRYLTRNFGYWKLQGVPEVKPYPIFGSEYDFFTEPHLLDLQRAKTYGKLYGTYFCNEKTLNVTDPEIIKLILVKDFPHFINRRGKKTGSKTVDSGLAFALDDDWKRIRSVISPTFSLSKIKKLTTTVKSISKKMVQHVATLAEKGELVDMKKEFCKFSSEIIGLWAYGIYFDAFECPDHPFIKNCEQFFEGGVRKYSILLLAGALPRFLVSLKIKLMDAIGFQYFKDTGVEIIKKRRTTDTTDEKAVDFLQQMIEAKKGKEEDEDPGIPDKAGIKKPFSSKTLDEDEVVAQCVQFLIGGHNTITSTLAFTVYYLACYPDVQEKVLREIDETWNAYGDFDYDVVQNMPYLEAVIFETLRLQPVGANLTRHTKNDYLIPGTTITIPKDTIISISLYALHRNPEFFPEPEKFNPDRFLPENKQNILPFTYLPFADGPRNCIARRFSMFEMKLCLACFLRHIKLSRTELTKMPMEFFIILGTLQSKEVIVRAERRNTGNII